LHIAYLIAALLRFENWKVIQIKKEVLRMLDEENRQGEPVSETGVSSQCFYCYFLFFLLNILMLDNLMHLRSKTMKTIPINH